MHEPILGKYYNISTFTFLLKIRNVEIRQNGLGKRRRKSFYRRFDCRSVLVKNISIKLSVVQDFSYYKRVHKLSQTEGLRNERLSTLLGCFTKLSFRNENFFIKVKEIY